MISVIHVWSRLLSVKKILRTMPKPYMPTKQIDVPRVSRVCTLRYLVDCPNLDWVAGPRCFVDVGADIEQKVADHIMIEYSRTTVIAHISQATTSQQEGWGRPGGLLPHLL